MYRNNNGWIRYKNEIQDIFNPTLKKANVPNYYQQKGRTIQQSPLRIKNSDTTTITRKELEKMYNTLIKYKFPIPFQGTRPVVVFNLEYDFNEIFVQPDYTYKNEKFIEDSLKVFRTNFKKLYLSGEWSFRILYVQLLNLKDSSIDSNSQYNIRWISNLMDDTNGLFAQKIYNDAIIETNRSQFASATCSLESGNYYIKFSSFIIQSQVNITRQADLANSLISMPSNSLPFMDSSASIDDMYYGYFQYNQTQGSMSELSINFVVYAYPL